MEKVSIPGRELRYWDLKANVKDEAGNEVVKPGWVKKETTITSDHATNLQEAMELGGGTEEGLLKIVNDGVDAAAAQKAGTVPEGCFSKGMVQAITKALGSSPQFKALQRSEKRDAVMAFVSGNDAICQGMLIAMDGLRTAAVEDEEE